MISYQSLLYNTTVLYDICSVISLNSQPSVALSRKFWSAENFGPGPIFSLKILVPRTNFFEKLGPALKNLVPLFFRCYS